MPIPRELTTKEANKLAYLVREDAEHLERWASEAENGGWSTIHVRPMRQRAKKLREELQNMGQ
jgi:hypothetical protein